MSWSITLSAIRKLIGEAQRNGIIGADEAANLAGVRNLSQKGTRLGNWLTRDQAKKLLTVPDRSLSLRPEPSAPHYHE
jgi:hypothetical protein